MRNRPDSPFPSGLEVCAIENAWVFNAVVNQTSIEKWFLSGGADKAATNEADAFLKHCQEQQRGESVAVCYRRVNFLFLVKTTICFHVMYLHAHFAFDFLDQEALTNSAAICMLSNTFLSHASTRRPRAS